MAVVSTAAFARRFRRCSPCERRVLLAAIWSARGYDTRIEDGVVLADGQTIDVIGRWPWGRTDTTADVLVGTHDTPLARRYARGHDATFVSPAALRDVLLYGIDRQAAERIAQTHLGCPVTGATTGTGTGTSGPDSTPIGREYRLTAVLVGIVLAVAVIALAGVGSPTGVIGSTTAGTVDDTDFGTGAIPVHADTGTDPPAGLSATGVENASALATTHHDLIVESQRTSTVRYTGPANTSLFSNATRYESTLQAHSSYMYRYSVRQTVREGKNQTRMEYVEYSDGARIYSQFRVDGGEPEIAGGDWMSGTNHRPDREQDAITTLYAGALSAPGTGVTTIERQHDVVYEVRVAGDPETFPDETTDFRAVAYVTSDGQLLALAIRYVHPETGDPVAVDVTYHDVGELGHLDPPAWIDVAR